MAEPDDPFAHHPRLRDKITPAEASFFRDFSTAKMAAILAENGLPTGWWYDDAEREATRLAALEQHRGGDLWVFAYGSLMWDPALVFAEVRRAYAPDHARRFILRDTLGGRGTPEAPGLMAALDGGRGCHGLAFRIAANAVDLETDILWRREMIGPGYLARFIPIEIDGKTLKALSFLADHDSNLIAGDLDRATQIDHLVTGKGILGTSFDYLRNVVEHLHEIAIPDPDLDALMAEAAAQRTAAPGR